MKNCPKCEKPIVRTKVDITPEKTVRSYKCGHCGFATTRTSRPIPKIATAIALTTVTRSPAQPSTEAGALLSVVGEAREAVRACERVLTALVREVFEMPFPKSGLGPEATHVHRVLSRIQNEAATHCVELQNLSPGSKRPTAAGETAGDGS